MIWPFRRKSSDTGSIPRSSRKVGAAFYVSRPRVESALTQAVSHSNNVVVYGPSHQGKTMLLGQHMPKDAIVIECRPDFKRSQIYRVILSSLGYAVLVEKKRNTKATTTLKLGFHVVDAEVNAEGGLEQTMQPVTVDLKNPSEVALLITRIRNLPWIVLNNFQLLDEGTKRTLLFDLATFAEKPDLRIMVVGAWPNEDYLEEIEPAVAGKFKYVYVPAWSDNELKQAAAHWADVLPELAVSPHHLHQFCDMAAGDISLFRSLIETSAAATDPAQLPVRSSTDIQSMVLTRFRRGFSTKLQALFAERDSYVGFLTLLPTVRLSNNPDFKPNPEMAESEYLLTSVNPQTKRPWVNGREVRLDADNNAQYLEVPWAKVQSMQINLAAFLTRNFHAAALKGARSIPLATLANDFLNSTDPQPIRVEPSRLRAALLRIAEAQRQALIVPPMLATDSSGQAIEIRDQRLFLFLQNLTAEDLDELIDASSPGALPSPRRHNQISRAMTANEEAEYIESVMSKTAEDEQTPTPEPVPATAESGQV